MARFASLVDALTQMPFVRVVDSDGANLLTKREEDLVRLVADGLSNRDIARKLNLSEHTVKNYIFRIFDKVGVSNRVELVLYAFSNSRRAEASTSSDHAPKPVVAHGLNPLFQGNAFIFSLVFSTAHRY